jgi:hypothetical protein
MDEILDELIEEVEVMNTEIAKINFEIDGFKEESDRLVDKQPFMVRQIQQNEKKMIKLLKNLKSRMTYKSELDLKLDVAQKVYRDKKDSATKTIKKIKTK